MTDFGRYRERLASLEFLCGRVAGAFVVVGGVGLVALLGVTVAEVVARYLLNDSLLGAEDLSTMSLTFVAAGAVAYGAREGAHVCVNVVGRYAGRAVTRVTDAVARLLALGGTALAAYALFVKGGCGLACGAVTGSISIVHTPFYYVLGASMAAYALLLASRTLLGFALWHGEDPNELGD